MNKQKSSEILKKFSEQFKKPEDTKYAILKYIAYVYAISLPFIIILSYFNPCFLNLVIPGIAIIVPYVLFKEKSLKNIFVVGLVAVLLLSLTFTVFQVEAIYFSQEPGDLSSDVLSDGTVDKIYGGQNTKFNFTVDLDTQKLQTENYTVFLNITWKSSLTTESGNNTGFEMNKVNNSSYYFVFNLKENDMEDRLYSHHFSIRKVDSSGDIEWEETDSNFGPFSISRLDAYQIILLNQLTQMILFFIIFMGLLWWRRRMTTSREKSTEGLEEKEEELEDYCPECGTLLEGETTCPECGLDVESYEAEQKETEVATKEDIEEELFEEED